MSGDERARHCAKCQLKVFNVSALTETEVHELVAKANGGRVCVRFYQRRDGTVLTKDCPVGRQTLRRRLLAGFTAAVAVGLATLSSLSSAATPASCPSGRSSTAAQLEDWLREVPLVGQLVEWVNPRPTFEMGKIAPSTPPPVPPGATK